MARSPAPAFGPFLDKLLKDRQLSAADLARALDISAPQVSRWLSGQSRPSIDNVRALADYLGVSQETMETIAGYRANTVTSAQATVNPELAAQLDAEVNALRELIRGIPAPFWPVVLGAVRESSKLARMNVEAAISLAQNDELADHERDAHEKDDDTNRGPRGPLTASLLVTA